MFNPIGSKATVCAFTNAPGIIVTGHESGKMALFDVKTGDEVLNNERAHMDNVTDLQLSQDRTYFITSSKDKTARVCTVLFGQYLSDCLTRSDSIAPRDQVAVGAQNVSDRNTAK